MRPLKSFAQSLTFALALLAGASSQAQSSPPSASQIHPQWIGTWRSATGAEIVISDKQLETRVRVKQKNAKPRIAVRTAFWDHAEALGDDGDGPGSFAYLGHNDSLHNITELFERAVASSSDPRHSDMHVEKPDFIRKQLAGIRPGSYRVIQADWGSPCELNGFYMIVDRDRLLQYYSGRYSFGATLFKRVK